MIGAIRRTVAGWFTADTPAGGCSVIVLEDDDAAARSLALHSASIFRHEERVRAAREEQERQIAERKEKRLAKYRNTV